MSDLDLVRVLISSYDFVEPSVPSSASSERGRRQASRLCRQETTYRADQTYSMLTEILYRLHFWPAQRYHYVGREGPVPTADDLYATLYRLAVQHATY